MFKETLCRIRTYAPMNVQGTRLCISTVALYRLSYRGTMGGRGRRRRPDRAVRLKGGGPVLVCSMADGLARAAAADPSQLGLLQRNGNHPFTRPTLPV